MVTSRGCGYKRRHEIQCTSNKGKQAHVGKNTTQISGDQAQLKKGTGFQQMGPWNSNLGAPFLKRREDPGEAEVDATMEVSHKNKRRHNYKYCQGISQANKEFWKPPFVSFAICSPLCVAK